MVMPFGQKAVDRVDPGIPAEIDFDVLWERVYEPALTQLGYEAVRADRDVGALIIQEMIQRLTVADLVVADVTLPNANVYYEVGVRHAAASSGCVLVAADWARATFDLLQMRQLRFALTDGTVPQDQADVARTKLVNELQPLIEGTSPVFEAVTGYPDHIDSSLISAFRSTVQELSAFDAEVRAVRLLPAAQRPVRAREVVRRYGYQPAVSDAVALRLLQLVHDTARCHDDWAFELDFIASLPARLASRPAVLERRALALGKKGDVVESAAELEQLIAKHGGTSERYGLLGGRYKTLMAGAEAPQRRWYLSKAIESYENGMRLDLNDYYPSGNLPRLYRERGSADDLVRADEVAVIVTDACRRAVALGLESEWTKSTLLGMAFYRGDVIAARTLTGCVQDEGPGVWQLESTIGDLAKDVEQHRDPTVRADLAAVLDELRQLLPRQALST